MNPAFYPYAFTLGMASLASPCVAITIPGLISHSQGRISRVASFIAGYALSTFLLVLSTILLGKLWTATYGSTAYLLAGLVTGLSGFTMIGIIKPIPGISFSTRSCHPFLSGLFLGGVSLTCVGPALAGLFGIALLSPDVMSKISLSGFFVLGSVTPFFLYGYSMTRPTISQFISTHLPLLQKGTAYIMLAMSAFMISLGLGGVNLWA